MIVLFGVGKYLKNNIEWIKKFYNVSYLSDNDPSKWGKFFFEIECISPSELKNMDCEVLITVEDAKIFSEIRKQLLGQNIKVGNLYAYPVSGCEIKKVMVWAATIDEMRKTRLILQKSNQIEVVGYITCNVENIGFDEIANLRIVSLFKAEKMLLSSTIDGIVTATESFGIEYVTTENVKKEVLESGKYYVMPRNTISKLLWSPNDIEMEDILVPYKRLYRLSMLQFTVIPQCNLKCKLCSHFAGLIDEKEIYTFEQFVKDIEKTREMFDDVESIHIWGGEALMCENLHRYLYVARQCYPNASIFIGTNGLLIQKMNEDLIQAIKETGTTIAISMYPPTLNIIDDVVKFLRDKQISFITALDEIRIKRFFRRFDIEGNNDIKDTFEECSSNRCVTVYKGKICSCYFPLFAPFFNKAFGHYFDVEADAIDIHSDKLTKNMLIDKLRKPMNSCKYCSPKQFEEWSVIGKERKMSDWVYCRK